MKLLHSHLTLGLFLGVFTSALSQDSYWSNFIGRVPEGVAGVDYPDLTSVPKRTSFTCRDRKPGFYADPETRCQAWHWCDTFLVKHSFLCANMTLFNQKIRGCDWWYNVDCGQAVSQYSNNDELYQTEATEPEVDRRRHNRKEFLPATPLSNDLGAEQSVHGFTVTNAVSQQPEVDLDFARSHKPEESLNFDESLLFSASSPAPSTVAPFFDTSATTARPVLSSSPSTRGVLRVQPSTRAPVRQIFVRPNTGGFQINIANAIPIVFPPPPPKVLPKPTTAALKPDVTTANGLEIQRDPSTFSEQKPLTITKNGLTKPRRRLRVRTQPTTRVAPVTFPASSSFANQPSTEQPTSFRFQPSTEPPTRFQFQSSTEPPTSFRFQQPTTKVAPAAFPASQFDSQPTAEPLSSNPVKIPSATTRDPPNVFSGSSSFANQPSTVPPTNFQFQHSTTRVTPGVFPTSRFSNQPSTVPPTNFRFQNPTTTRVAPTALPAFPFAAPPGSSPIQLNDFFAPQPQVPAFGVAAVQDISLETQQPFHIRTTTTTTTPAPSTQQQKLSRFPEFPQRVPTTSFGHDPARVATSRPFFVASSTEHIDRPTVAFNFGIPFGARIKPGEEILDQSATVRRSDTFLTTDGTEPEVASRNKRKFVEIGKTSFPPFSVSTVLLPKFTKLANPSTQLVVDLSTAATSISANDDSATGGEIEKLTPKPTKLRRRKMSTNGVQWPATTIVPITTFRPSVTNDLTSGQEVTDNSTDTVSLQDDISLS